MKHMLRSTVAFVLAAIGTAILFLLSPLNSYCRRNFCLYDTPPDLKTLHIEVKKTFDSMQENIKKWQDSAEKAIEEVRKEGTVYAKTADELKKIGEDGAKMTAEFKELKDRLLAVEQKGDRKPGPGDAPKSAGQMVIESAEYKAMSTGKGFKMDPVTVEAKAIFNATLNNDQPLVQADRIGMIMPVTRRLTIRDLLPQLRTTSNLIEAPSELLFTNNAGPQGGGSSPTETEGQRKPESNITFQLGQWPVITLAHFVAASRQVLADAPQLQSYIDSRLGYGLKLEEEDELLNSAGTNGELNGLMNQATAFSGGATNQTALDTLLKAFNQVSLAFYESSGVVMHPTDWTNLMMLKDTTGRYLFSDPQAMGQPRVWGKPVVPTPAQTQGQFLTGAFDLAAAIYDREDMTVRIAEQHEDFFVRNMVAILCEERLALVVYRAAALVKGALNTAG